MFCRQHSIDIKAVKRQFGILYRIVHLHRRLRGKFAKPYSYILGIKPTFRGKNSKLECFQCYLRGCDEIHFREDH